MTNQPGTVVDIEESTERFSEVKLKDGTIIKLKPVVFEVVRLEKWDSEGNPIYNVRSSTTLAATNIDESLKKKVN